MKVERYGRLAGIYYRKTQTYMKKAFKKLGVTFDEGIVLQHVLLNPGTAQDCIAEALALDTAAVARSLKSLEQKGYLTRSTDMENQRRKLVNITAAGIRVSNQIDLAAKIWDEAVFEGLSEEQVDTLIQSALFFQQRISQIDISTLLTDQIFE